MEFEDEHEDEQEEEEEEDEDEGITIPPQPNYDPVIHHNSTRPSNLNTQQLPGGSNDNNVNNTDGNPIPAGGGGGAAGGAGRGSSGGRKLYGGGGTGGSSMVMIRYRECLKNHAVNIGGHAVDGCGEFMPAGEEGTLDALKCAACSCHRNFHRKETEGELSGAPISGGPGGVLVGGTTGGGGGALYPQFPTYYRTPGPAGYLHVAPTSMTTPASTHHHHHLQQHHHHQNRPLALPSASGGTHSRDEMDDMSHPSSSGGGGGGNHTGGGSGFMKKRFRTKFSQEQKDKMLAFAEKLGWRIQKHDEAAVQQFCHENQVRRQVFKVWMHNNKNTLGKKP